MKEIPIFFGIDLSTEELDAIAIKCVKKDELLAETNLFATKWFDYRSFHPARSTYLFAHYYRESYKQDMATHFDLNRSKYMRGIKELDFSKSRERAAIWRARQQADALGIPYDRFVTYAIKYCRKVTKWKRTPRPCHLTADDVVEGANNSWLEELSFRTRLPTIYAKLDIDSVEHKNIQRWLCTCVKSRLNSIYSVQNFIQTNSISEEIALECFNKQSFVGNSK